MSLASPIKSHPSDFPTTFYPGETHYQPGPFVPLDRPTKPL
jgi:hypothetical protein